MATAATKGGKRPYNSTRRQQQAAETRELVLDAATSLFATRGWSGTGMRDIAKQAGVALETVYAYFGSKTDLLLTAVDVGVVGDAAPVPVTERPEFTALGAGSRADRVAATARLVTAINQRSWGLQRAVREGAVSEPQLAERLVELEQQRRESVRQGAELVLGQPVDDPTLDGLWALLGTEVFQLLTEIGGRSLEDYESWLRYAITQLIEDSHG